jgi:hypothetical protein
VIIFGSIRFLSKTVTKPKLKKKTKMEPKLVQTDWFWFGSVFLGQKLVQTCLDQFFGLARFFPVWLGFSVLARFFPVWLGFLVLARFFPGFFRLGFDSVFPVKFIKPKPNRTGQFFQNFNRFNQFFYGSVFSIIIFLIFLI